MLGRDGERNRGRLDLRLRTRQATLHRLLGNQERPRDLLRPQPAERAQRERNLRLEIQRGMAAGENQLEPLVLDHRVVQLVHRHFGHLQLPGLLGQRSLSPDPVDRPVARGDRQPRARVGRNSVAGPSLRGNRKRLLGGLLGEIEIAEETDQRGKHTPPLVPENLSQQRYRSTNGRTSIAPPKRAAGIRAASSIASSRLSASNT